jgi:hypothetical protein
MKMLELDEALEQYLEESPMAWISARILTGNLQDGGYIRPEGMISFKEARTVSSTRYSIWISVVDIVSPMIVRGRQVESGKGVNKYRAQRLTTPVHFPSDPHVRHSI